MPQLWRTLAFFLALSISHSFAASQSFENTAIVRTVDLGGALVHLQTTYAAKALTANAKTYTLALSEDEFRKTSWFEVKTKGSSQVLDVTNNGFDAECACYLFDVTLPKALAVDETVNILLETIQTHATWPWPATAAQSDPQSLKYQTDLFVLSPYVTQVLRSKIKSSSPNYLSYTQPEKLDQFTSGSPVTKSGATLTYGPFNKLPATAALDFQETHQQRLTIHYTYDNPVLEVLKLRRSAEISHWGANLNIQDEIHLHNGGPKLKGHFSRLEHQSQNFYKRNAAHVLPGLAMYLPAGIRNPYYYDLIGNVSTSQLRIAPSPKRGKPAGLSVLQLKPRYPILGGWNYTFTLGWDAPLEDSVKWDASTGKYIAQIPIMTEIPTAVVNDAELKIILPEGATDYHYIEPFPALTTEVIKHVTYLDTAGRPTIVLQYSDLTNRHAQSIYVSYRVPLSAHMKKPFAVAAAFFSLFAFALGGRRVNLSIKKKRV